MLGPMVYAAAFCEAGDEAAMAKMWGFPSSWHVCDGLSIPWRTQASVI